MSSSASATLLMANYADRIDSEDMVVCDDVATPPYEARDFWTIGTQDALTVAAEFIRSHLMELRRYHASLITHQERTLQAQARVAELLEVLKQSEAIRKVATDGESKGQAGTSRIVL